MNIAFNSINRVDKPQFALCNPGCVLNTDGSLSSAICFIPNTEAEENIFNFNSLSELNFRANLFHPETGAEYDDEYWDYILFAFQSIQNRRLIYQEDVGFFEITNVTEGHDEYKDYKDVQAKSIENELSHWKVPLVDGTTSFKNLLDTVVHAVPLWSIDSNIDATVTGKYRTFEDVDTNENCLSFMMEEMQEAYECIFLFDIQSRVISAFDKNTYLKETGIFLSTDDLIPSATIDNGSEDMYTALNVSGDNDITIHPVNPLGNGVIYNFDYYVSWMPKELGDMVAEWEKAVERQEVRREAIPDSVSSRTYVELSEKYYDLLDKINIKKMEKQTVEQQRDVYAECIDNIENSVSKRIDTQSIMDAVESAQSG